MNKLTSGQVWLLAMSVFVVAGSAFLDWDMPNAWWASYIVAFFCGFLSLKSK